MEHYKKRNHSKGNIGEDIASQYLLNLNYEIIERNWHFSKYSEIDIIAKTKNGTYVFVEVKMRTNTFSGHPFEAVTESKLKKIQLATLEYMNNFVKDKNAQFRVDVISVIGTINPQIEHLENISF